MNMFSAIAFAQEASAPAAAPPGGMLASFVPFILIFVLFYFLLIRPQQTKQKKHRALLESLKKGDKVVTNSGILGTVMNLSKDVVTLQAGENVKLRILRDSISDFQKEE